MHDVRSALRAVGVGSMTMLLVSCGTSPTEHEAYRHAEERLKSAQAKQAHTVYAGASLKDVQRTLDQAADASDETELMHLTYLAERKLDIADAIVVQREAETRRQALVQAQREKVQETRLDAPVASAEAVDQEKLEVAIRDSASGQERTEELEQALVRFQSSATASNAILTLPDVLFDSGKSTLSPGAERNLDPLASYLRNEARGKIIVQGHTDNTGSEERNMQLSLARASAVKAFFAEKGVAEDRLFTLGLGANYPIVSNDTPEGRQRNRRVELIIERPGLQTPPTTSSR